MARLSVFLQRHAEHTPPVCQDIPHSHYTPRGSGTPRQEKAHMSTDARTTEDSAANSTATAPSTGAATPVGNAGSWNAAPFQGALVRAAKAAENGKRKATWKLLPPTDTSPAAKVVRRAAKTSDGYKLIWSPGRPCLMNIWMTS
ncbi:hypothetical protein H257_17403 [Aphanomyces astaci]|uniref:Uncharacterized protein n=1 Tax=Aphanomyces astaci TaxID=112090 RepID=W4FGJ1_APHAT|nr:hypothetical protein H257_17403 [Aphanomyces astaci]ETV65984.1 hypothetical protein H257_17403 [Aphanomyces astaci]|eukprot:XP_009844503.1 hypothetical protein H257_17403 [Aphanomyces astaci]